MALIRSVRGFTPKIGEDCFIAETAAIIGDIVIGNECSIWYSAVLRGDVNSIRIGDRVNVQDGAVLHTLYQKSTVEIGNNVTIAHNSCIHGAKINDFVLVGIGAIILDHVEVGENSIIAAGAVVLTGTKIEPNSIYAGNPARRIKDVNEEQTRVMIDGISKNYKMYSDWYK
jgi:carbonic anhydrase/acetyltransferase-like protein (isoleucine patch superfamily)